MKYRKYKPAPGRNQLIETAVLGMLYLADLRFVNRRTGEKVKQRVLVIGNEAADVERKVRWIFDANKHDEFSISSIEKVREKVHVLSTTVTQERDVPKAVIDRNGRSQEVHDPGYREDSYKLYAVGITTKMPAKDESHALRKVGSAVLASGSGAQSHAARLSADSTIQIEKISQSSGFAAARDVSTEERPAHFVRG